MEVQAEPKTPTNCSESSAYPPSSADEASPNTPKPCFDKTAQDSGMIPFPFPSPLNKTIKFGEILLQAQGEGIPHADRDRGKLQGIHVNRLLKCISPSRSGLFFSETESNKELYR